MNTRDNAQDSLHKIIKPVALKDIYSNDESVMLRETDYKLLYNESHGLIPDILEAFELKKQDHRWFWAAVSTASNSICKLASGGSLKSLIKDIIVGLITDLLVDPLQSLLETTMLDDLVDLIIGIVKLDVCDVLFGEAGLAIDIPLDAVFVEQIAQLRESVRSGRHVFVVAHSQGNLFFNEVYNALYNNDKWMTDYINTVAVASPSSKVLSKATAVMFDNDPIRYVWGEEKGLIENPLRYAGPKIIDGLFYDEEIMRCETGFYFNDDLQKVTSCLAEHDFETDIDITSLKFHSFEYYMSPTISANGAAKDNPSYGLIIEALKKYIQASKDGSSQWKVKQNGSCAAAPSCANKLKYVKHKFDDDMNVYMQSIIYPFANLGASKIYPVKGLANYTEYVKAGSFEGYKIAADHSLIDDYMACYALKNENDDALEFIDDSPDVPTAPTSGYVEVSLAWENADIDMDLRVVFPGGVHDVQDECQLMEHFYALNDKEVTPGLYPVYISYGAGKDINQSQKELQNIVVTIKVPGATEARTVNLKTIDSLPTGGHIADIKVEAKKIELVLRDEFRTNSVVLYNSPESGYSSSDSNGGSGSGGYGYSGGYGGGGGGGSAGWGYSYAPPPITNDYIYSIIWHISQALLGPLAGANISVYALENYDLNANNGSYPVYSGASSYGSSVYTAGVINIPREIMDSLDDEKIYVIEAKGGMDIDANDDKIADAAPVINLGSIRALASGSALKNIGFKVNILTEMAYQISRKRYDSADISKLTSKSDEVVKCLLNDDINLDGVTNTIDALYFTPYSDKGKLYANYYGEFMPVIRKLLAGGDIYGDSFSLYARPLVKGGYFDVNEAAAVGAIFGKIETDCVSESPVHSFVLSGAGAENFQVDSAGNLKIAKRLVYEEKRIYTLSVVGINAYGAAPAANVYITVTADNSPIIMTSSFTSYVFENMPNGSLLGQIIVNDMGYPVTSMSLEGFGAEYFNIDNQGKITVARGDKINVSHKEYALKATAANAVGQSAPSSVKLTIHDDAPVILDNIYATIREDSAKGRVIAKPSYYQGLSSVKEFKLEGSGAENFDISADGTITIAQEANISTEFSPYRLSISARNDHGVSASRLVTINVIPVVNNDAPPPENVPVYSVSLYDFSANIYVTASANTIVGKIAYGYAYAMPTAFSLSGTGSERFSVSSSGVITLINNSGLNAGEVFNFEANASNEYVSSAKSQVRITVIDDTPRVNDFSVSIVEGLEGKTAIGKVGYSYGVSPITKFEIIGGGEFTIDGDGTIRIKEGTVIDYDVKNLYTFTIKITNAIGKTAQSAGSVRVISDAPTISGGVFSVMENSYGGEYVGRVSIVSNGRSVITSFSLSGEGAELFDIDKSGNIKTAEGSVIDYETKIAYNLKAAAANDHDTSSEVSVTINVINAPDQEPVLKPTTLYVDENSPAGTIAGDIEIFAQGFSAITSFAITGVNADWFDVDKNGRVTLSENAKLDYESKKVFSLKAQAISDYGSSALVDLTINVNNMPDLPPVVSRASFYVDENSPAGTFVGRLTINSADSPVTSVVLSGTGAERFSVNNDGTIVVAEGANLDYESVNRYSLSAKAVNIFGESNTAYVYIYLNNLKDTPPVLQNTHFSVHKRTPANKTLGTIKLGTTIHCDITEYVSSGDSIFGVRDNGEVYTKTGVTEGGDYDISVYAKSVCGDSNTVSLTIDTQSYIIGQIAMGGSAMGVALSSDNTKAFVADYNNGLRIVDVSDPANPALIGQIATGYAYGVALSSDNTKAFVAGNGLQIVNVSDPFSPSLIGQIATERAQDVALSSDNTKAFVANYYSSNGLQIIDISDPANPALIGQIAMGGSAMGVALSSDNTKAFAASYGIEVVDISDPANTALIGQIVTLDSRDVALSSDNTKAFVADYYNGLQIIDVSDPANPALIGQVATGSTYDVALSSDNTKAFVAGQNGLWIIDVEDFTKE
ncbi:MAG: cadherin domain-containing protein [Helicobacteraceae bacterium]|nr:cadherin domain-containing protein [Helicobacteraceae bacterium]